MAGKPKVKKRSGDVRGQQGVRQLNKKHKKVTMLGCVIFRLDGWPLSASDRETPHCSVAIAYLIQLVCIWHVVACRRTFTDVISDQ